MEATFMTIPQAADYLRISEPTLYRWMKEGKLSFYKVGDSTRFRKENLDMVLEKHTGTAEADYYGARCVACGHSELVEGQIVSTGKVYFKPQKTKFFTLLESSVNLDARACRRCGFIQLFSDTDKLNRLLPETKKEGNQNEPT